MAPVGGYNSNGSTLDSISTVSFNGTSGGGGVERKNPSLSQTFGEIDKHLSQLKCKRAFQDEDSLNGLASSVVSRSPEVSQLLASTCGGGKNDLKTDVRNDLKEMEGFFKEIIKLTGVSNRIKVKEGLMELFHNPEHLVFQRVISNEPVEWGSKLGLPVLVGMERKKGIKEEIRRDILEFQGKRRELSKDIGLEKKRLQELGNGRKWKEEKMEVDNGRRLKIALEGDKNEADKIEEQLSKNGGVISNEEVDTLVGRFKELRLRHEDLRDELQRLSVNGVLPPDIVQADSKLQNKKEYLTSLLHQIANPLDVSSGRSFDNSVFQ